MFITLKTDTKVTYSFLLCGRVYFWTSVHDFMNNFK